MPSLTTSSLPFSPAELSYIHSSLVLQPPIRPDGRSSQQFRPVTAETDVLPAVNGSAHVGFEDGGEALVGIKAEVEKRRPDAGLATVNQDTDEDVEMSDAIPKNRGTGGRQDWVALSLDISGTRDDDSSIAFLSEMLREALVAGNALPDRLVINNRWHWKLYIDVLLLSPPSPGSLPLPLLSVTIHLALLSTRLPRLKSEEEEDPLFDDDWEASQPLYPRSQKRAVNQSTMKPPITLLVAQICQNVIFDPSREELAVAEGVVAVSVGPSSSDSIAKTSSSDLKILSIRTIDPASRNTFPGVPRDVDAQIQGSKIEGVWLPPRGGVKRSFLKSVMSQIVEIARDIMTSVQAYAG